MNKSTIINKFISIIQNFEMDKINSDYGYYYTFNDPHDRIKHNIIRNYIGYICSIRKTFDEKDINWLANTYDSCITQNRNFEIFEEQLNQFLDEEYVRILLEDITLYKENAHFGHNHCANLLKILDMFQKVIDISDQDIKRTIINTIYNNLYEISYKNNNNGYNYNDMQNLFQNNNSMNYFNNNVILTVSMTYTYPNDNNIKDMFEFMEKLMIDIDFLYIVKNILEHYNKTKNTPKLYNIFHKYLHEVIISPGIIEKYKNQENLDRFQNYFQPTINNLYNSNIYTYCDLYNVSKRYDDIFEEYKKFVECYKDISVN